MRRSPLADDLPLINYGCCIFSQEDAVPLVVMPTAEEALGLATVINVGFAVGLAMHDGKVDPDRLDAILTAWGKDEKFEPENKDQHKLPLEEDERGWSLDGSANRT